jgi:hypothetical protein
MQEIVPKLGRYESRSSTGGIVGSDATDAATLDANGLNVEDAPFVIGAAAASGSYADHF